MKEKQDRKSVEGVRKIWDRYKYAILVALIGAGLLLWPGGGLPGSEDQDRADTGQAASENAEREVRELQREMEEIIGTMSGVGQVRVMLTMDSDGERQLAQDSQLSYSGDTAAPEDYSRSSEVVLTGGSGGGAVIVRTLYPTYRGALVVCEGGDRAEVRLAVTEAVSALTGLPSDRVTVAKWQ